MVGVFGHLGCEVNFGAIEVSHCHPVLRCFSGKVGKCLIYRDQVVGYVASLDNFFLSLLEFGSGFD